MPADTNQQTIRFNQIQQTLDLARGSKVVQSEDGSEFQATPYMVAGGNEVQTLALVAVGVKLLKTEKGQTILRDIAVKYLDNLGKIVSTLEHSSSSNWLTCAMNQRLCARVLKNLGMISADEASEYMSWLTWVVGAMITKGYITETVGALSHLGSAFGMGGSSEE